jgi:hypothetical protein
MRIATSMSTTQQIITTTTKPQKTLMEMSPLKKGKFSRKIILIKSLRV